MTCQFCNGTKETTAVVTHSYTNKLKICSVPCVCFSSSIVSMENKLLSHLGEEYLHPDKLDPKLIFTPQDIFNSPNLIIRGHYDALLLNVKALLMRGRFDNPKPRILFSRAIDIIHDFHVPNMDEVTLHLSSTSIYDLMIIVFGTNEKNKAIGPCMAQLVKNRKEEHKPTWIYLPDSRPNLISCDQEYSEELEQTVKDYKNIEIFSDKKLNTGLSESKNRAASYRPGS